MRASGGGGGIEAVSPTLQGLLEVNSEREQLVVEHYLGAIWEMKDSSM